MWFLGVFLMHAPHCHYGPLLGGDRDGAEGVDGCWCRAACHYSVYWVVCARHFPQNGRGAPTWLRLRGVNDLVTSDDGHKIVKHIHLLLACVWNSLSGNTITTVLLLWFRCLFTAEGINEQYLQVEFILLYCLGETDVKWSVKKQHSVMKYVQEHYKFPRRVWVT